MISIIIPAFNQHEITRECFLSILSNTKDPFEIIIIDNGSDLPVFGGFQDEHIVLIRNEENLGFPKAVNQGIKAANGDVIAILNNDVIITPNCFEILQSHLSNGFDIVGPVTNSISGPQQILIDQYDDLTTLYKAAEGLQKEKKGQSYPYHRLVFFCVAIKREVIDKIGLLDEIYTPGNCEDDDFCMQAIEAGFKLGVAEDCYVHHFGSVTHKAMNIEYGKLLAKNQKIFNEKWGDRYKEMVKRHNG